MRKHLGKFVLPPLAVALVGIDAWELAVVVFHIQPYIVPAPASVAEQLKDSFGLLWSATIVSGSNALIGAIAGTLLAIVIAILVHRWRSFDQLVGTLASGAAAIPIVALAPLFYGMFSDTSEIARRMVVTLVVFFPIYVNVAKALKVVPKIQEDLMHTYSASRWESARYLEIPSAMPFLFSGLRVAVPAAVISSIVAEYFGGPQNGLAVLIASSAQASDFAQAWAFVFASVMLGLIAFGATATLEQLARRRLHSFA